MPIYIYCICIFDLLIDLWKNTNIKYTKILHIQLSEMLHKGENSSELNPDSQLNPPFAHQSRNINTNAVSELNIPSKLLKYLSTT